MHLEPGRELGSEGKARLLRAVGAEEWGDCGSGAGARWRGFLEGRILGVRGGFGHGVVVAGGGRAACGVHLRYRWSRRRCAGKGGKVVWD